MSEQGAERSVLILVADAVKDVLAASLKMDVLRTWLPDVKTLSEIATTRVTVVPIAIVFERESRSQFKKTVQVDIGLQRKVSDSTGDVEREAADDVMSIASKITATLESNLKLPTIGASLSGITLAPTFDADTLRDKGVFMTVMNVTYTVTE